MTTFVPGKTELLGGSPPSNGNRRSETFNYISDQRIDSDISQLINQVREDLQFELNDQYTRLNTRQLVDRYLSTLRQRRAIYNYDVICDERNNTPETIDNGELHISAPICNFNGVWRTIT